MERKWRIETKEFYHTMRLILFSHVEYDKVHKVVNRLFCPM